MKPYPHAGFIALALIAAFAAGCSSSSPTSPTTTLHTSVANLPQLDQNHYYELWFAIPSVTKLAHGDHSYVRIAKFRVDASGNPIGLDGGAVTFAIPSSVNASLLEDAILTLETTSANDSLPGPRLLSGSFSGTAARGVAHLTLNGDDAFDNAFPVSASGNAILDTPTTPDSSDAASGIWFAHLAGADIHPGLEFATLPTVDENDRWTYRAWLLRNGGTASAEYISLGDFLRADSADGDGPGPYAGPTANTKYAAPGQDFVAAGHQRTLDDGTYGIVVSLDPIDGNLSTPFLPLLTGPIGQNLTGDRSISLSALQTQPDVDVIVDR